MMKNNAVAVLLQPSHLLLRRLCCWLLLITGLLPLGAGEWRDGPALHTARHGAASVVLDGKIYVIGGATTNGYVVGNVERFDPANGQWDNSSVAPLPDERFNAAAVVFDGKIYLAGGVKSNNEVSKEVYIYDPSANSWTTGEDMHRDRRGHVLTLIYGWPCAMAGIRDNGDFEEEIEYFDPGHNDWEEGPTDLPVLRVNPFAATVNNIFYMFGGIFNYPSDSSFAGTPDSSWAFTWETLPNLQMARGYGGTAVLGDSIFMMGGITSGGGASNAVDIYNPRTGQITGGPALRTPRIGMSAVTLNNAIFLMGGYESSSQMPTTRVEIFDTPNAITPRPRVAQSFLQIQGYPNPFNGRIQLQVTVAETGAHRLEIYDVSGRLVNALYDGTLTAGTHQFSWDGRSGDGGRAASGIYLAVMRSRSTMEKFKMVYVR